MGTEPLEALVIGAGPAGLMAAEQMAEAGLRVLVAEAKPSIGRKFLMAGKSGLNLTKDEPPEVFLDAFAEAAPHLAPMLDVFGPVEVKRWAEGLGQPVFTGSSGRVFPDTMKASPLLRAWAGRLSAAGVDFRTRWRWTGWSGAQTTFETPDGPQTFRAARTVLALGGASWARLGSDGTWADILAAEGVDLAPFRPANMGFQVAWSDHMSRHFGTPLKNIALIAGARHVRGECVISERGLEGGGIYAVSRALRDGAPLALDLAPDLSLEQVAHRLGRSGGKQSQSNMLRKALRLDPARIALLNEFARPLPTVPARLASVIKTLEIPHIGPRPMDEAISTAGGVRWGAVDSNLSLHARPNVRVAGEMLDWEAPTGGYLITGCLATGYWAGRMPWP
ncbi:hypothetical protein CLV78_10381 [Aliiruegeria haliotis]|uniref:NAD(FAD)-utilizing dehydrogenase n=1 Tax=Aliiruegeria haliotis TaxID=1280846 RepID=A0A2T0RSW2_9RHOB|nr:TIGR03862 family flavoprotein [Aliiruegeria haliotis]PRY24217.1 hypothetical protein CLV78_10381 [Aliiruegeria haliotis]